VRLRAGAEMILHPDDISTVRRCHKLARFCRHFSVAVHGRSCRLSWGCSDGRLCVVELLAWRRGAMVRLRHIFPFGRPARYD